MPVLLLTYVGFVSLGLPDASSGIAWPFLRDELGAAQSGLGLMLLCVGVGYIVSALCAGRVLQRFGVAKVLIGSTTLVALGLAGYASSASWHMLLACGPLIGLGSGAIDAGLNDFAARNYTAKQMIWLHACFGLGATLGPGILTMLLARGASWRAGYMVLAGLQAGCALAFFASRRAFERRDAQTVDAHREAAVSASSVLRNPVAALQILLFVVYAGLETSLGQWSFTVQKEGASASVASAGIATTAYWASLTGGRFLLGFATDWLGPVRIVRLSTVLAVVGCGVFATEDGVPRALGLALAGFALASIFPTLMSETPRRLGASAATHAVGWQVGAAMAGGLFFPSGLGWLAARHGLEVIPAVAVAAAVLLLILHEYLLWKAP